MKSLWKVIRIQVFVLLILKPLMGDTNDSNFILIGRWTNGSCNTITVNGDIAYIGNEDTLEIVDFSIPSTPVELGKILLPSVIVDISVSGSYAHIADRDSGLSVIEVSSPSNPIEVGFFNTEQEKLGLSVSGNYIYLVDSKFAENGRMHIIDVSTPSNPQSVGLWPKEYEEFNGRSCVDVSNNYAFLLFGGAVECNVWNGIEIIDISIPSNPQQVWKKNIGDGSLFLNANWITISGNYAYLAADYYGMLVYDISTPSNPQEVGNFSINDTITFGADKRAKRIYVSGNYVYLAVEMKGINKTRLWMIDVSTPSSPQDVEFFHTDEAIQDIVCSGNNIYVADGASGLYVLQSDLITSVRAEKMDMLPSSFILEQNYPNPFNPKTVISYQLPVSSHVELAIFNLFGQGVALLVSEKQPSGKYTYEWNGSNFESGVYYYRLTTEEFSQSKKLLLLK